MSHPDWLKKYFGPQLKTMDPSVVEEGKKYAVVRIQDHNQSGAFSRVGFILIQKNGKYGVTPHVSLFEGVPTSANLLMMKSRLEKQDS